MLEKLEKAKVNPSKMFQLGEYSGQFSAYDERGVPTADMQGQPLSKNRTKKFEAEYQAQKKLHDEYGKC